MIHPTILTELANKWKAEAQPPKALPAGDSVHAAEIHAACRIKEQCAANLLAVLELFQPKGSK